MPSEDTAEIPSEDTTEVPSEDTTEVPSEDTTEIHLKTPLRCHLKKECHLTYDTPSPNYYTLPKGGLGASTDITRISPSTRQVFSSTRVLTNDNPATCS
ncbi:hypothetical protein TNCV_2048341 [Trichonephila clavipes]|nr:hypothetical protein TNCV_2048341 [Trichonephila clavipes]